MLRKRQKGFTLIELLIVVAIIAIIAAIAIPNLLTALQKGRQKRTMGDMKTIGSALESYNTDYAFYPPGSTVSALKQYLTPFYIQSLPERDGWGTVFAYQTSASSGSTVQDVYSIISYGRNKAPGGGLGNPVFGQTYVCTSISHFDTDIYFSNGQFTWAPKQ